MAVTKWNVRAGAYYDSVVLMQLQRGLLGLSGVVDAGVVMATQANRELLGANNLLPDSVQPIPMICSSSSKPMTILLQQTQLEKQMSY